MSKLFLVPTPIGNLGDMTFRAVEVLKTVDLIFAEDTRTSQKLLSHYQIEKRLFQHHQFNERESTKGIIDLIKSGKTAAIVSDAGTPGISDAGFFIVRACIEEKIPVECLPGATAIIPALVQSGLPCERFVFEGFLPHKKGRETRLKILAVETRTMVFYESPHRLLKTLEQFVQHFGEERRACVCREITKLHEENFRGSVKEILAHFSKKEIKGEIVVVVAGFQS